jgi:hypothetical protein
LNRKTFESSTAPNTFNHYCYYDQSSPSGITFNNPIGHLTVTSTSLSVNNTEFLAASTMYWNYDAMGRVTGTMVCTPSTCNSSNIANSNWISLSNTYDLAGDETSYTDGLGTTIYENYDAAGR